MKKAFTLLEIIFVIVIIGVLSSVVIPNITSNKLREAAIQLVSHIRYTQHLAMIDDRYDVNSTDSDDKVKWYKERWQLKFARGEKTNGFWSYAIFSDKLGNGSGNPDSSEVAINPLDYNKKLTGGTTGGTMIGSDDDRATSEMNLGSKYGMLDIDFSSACRTAPRSKNLLFDSLGRPLRGNDRSYDASYDSGGSTNILIDTGCTITLCSVFDCSDAADDEKVVIRIESETGYTHIE